ncbi:NUAK family SNF1-like kinase 1 [Trichinella zimbabwensis]|uniref:NUAK family SNF1-like kinase 1 n=1 Tax=Trichinella zimbabwensis TaxID=268475 RepID=A0A0V1H7C8_9BILA|nr:NUAK family SNF1-like kinase 1 [Trichinella zimbabwensis]
MTIGNNNRVDNNTTSYNLSQSRRDSSIVDEESGRMSRRSSIRQRFEIVKKLGSGTYGKVSLAIDHRTSEQVAIKVIKKLSIENSQDLLRIRREIQVMSMLKHPNIIEIKEVFENDEKIVIIMEYASGGELYDYVSNCGPLAESEVRRMFRQIVSAVYFCHKNNVAHRDLKLENILLDKNMNAKIADFGLSNYFSDHSLLRTFCGSPLYASPEIINGIPYRGPEVDCWSLGVLLYSLSYSSMPFDGRDFNRMIRQIKRGVYYEPDNPSTRLVEILFCSGASTLIRIMLRVNSDRRATIIDIANHWWLNFDTDEPMIKDLPENKLSARKPGSVNDENRLTVQTFKDESEIFAEFVHLNAVTRRKVEEFRKKRKEADAFLSSSQASEIAGAGSTVPSSVDPLGRLQALERRLQAVQPRCTVTDQEITSVSHAITTAAAAAASPPLTTATTTTTATRRRRTLELVDVTTGMSEESETKAAIEQSIIAEGNRLANELMEARQRGQVSAELIEKVQRTHEKHRIDVLKEILDSILQSDQNIQSMSKSNLPDVVSIQSSLSRKASSDHPTPDLIKAESAATAAAGSSISTSRRASKTAADDNSISERGEKEEPDMTTTTVDFEDLEEDQSDDDDRSSQIISIVESFDSADSDSTDNKPSTPETATSAHHPQPVAHEADSDELSRGLSKRQSRGKYERSKFLFARDIHIEESPRLARKRIGGTQPDAKDAPMLFDKAKKYILQYPDALGSTDSLEIALRKRHIKLNSNTTDDGTTDHELTKAAAATDVICSENSASPKVYKVLWPPNAEDSQAKALDQEENEPEPNFDKMPEVPVESPATLTTTRKQSNDKQEHNKQYNTDATNWLVENQPNLTSTTLRESRQALTNARLLSQRLAEEQALPPYRSGRFSGLNPNSGEPSSPIGLPPEYRRSAFTTSTKAETTTTTTAGTSTYSSRYAEPASSTFISDHLTSGSHFTGHRAAPVSYSYFARPSYHRTLLENRENYEYPQSIINKPDDSNAAETGNDLGFQYIPRSDLRFYQPRSRYSLDYPKSSSEKTTAYSIGTKYVPKSIRSHSLHELSASRRRSNPSYQTSYSLSVDSDLKQLSTPRRRARSLYDTSESTTILDNDGSTSRHAEMLDRPSSALEAQRKCSTERSYNVRLDDNVSYRRSLYDVEDEQRLGTSGTRGSGASARLGTPMTKTTVKHRPLDKYFNQSSHETGRHFDLTNLDNAGYSSKPYSTVYPGDMGSYPKNPPDVGMQPSKGILKKKPTMSTSSSSTPTDEESGYGSVPQVDRTSTSSSSSEKASKVNPSWTLKTSSKPFNIMDKLRRRIGNGERASEEYDRPSAITTTTTSVNNGKYSKWTTSPTIGYMTAATTNPEKNLTQTDVLDKNQKQRKKKNIWNLGRRRTAEIGSFNPGDDSSYLKRPSSPLEKLKGFFTSGVTPLGSSQTTTTTSTAPPPTTTTKPRPSSTYLVSSASSKIKDRSSYSPLENVTSLYNVGGNSASGTAYRKYNKTTGVRPHSTYVSTGLRPWYDEGPFY